MKPCVELCGFLLGEGGTTFIGIGKQFAFFVLGEVYEQEVGQGKFWFALFCICAAGGKGIGAQVQLFLGVGFEYVFE